jgi:hypothetical protein
MDVRLGVVQQHVQAMDDGPSPPFLNIPRSVAWRHHEVNSREGEQGPLQDAYDESKIDMLTISPHFHGVNEQSPRLARLHDHSPLMGHP